VQANVLLVLESPIAEIKPILMNDIAIAHAIATVFHLPVSLNAFRLSPSNIL
jgi:hypothetical protein